MLTETQRRSLRRLAASDEAAPHVARRARWVLEVDTGVRRTDAAAMKWSRRYQKWGLAGLEDASRSGRPASLSDDDVRRILLEPLFIPSAKWTSRTLSEAVGISQATVVRLWARSFDPETLAEAGPWPSLDRSCRPTGLLCGPHGALLVLERMESARPPREAAAAAPESPWMRSPLRPALQTVLAGELVDLDHEAKVSTSTFLRAAMPDARAHYVVLCGLPAEDVDSKLLERPASVESIPVPEGQWQALLPHLIGAMAPSTRPTLENLSHRIREWAATRPGSGFRWTAQAPTAPEAQPDPPRLPARSLLLSPSQRLAEHVVQAILDGIVSGRLRGGDRLTESYLMRTVHASRSQVRESLRTLAMDGLIELRPGRGAIVPMPTGDDVLETYALRRAVGGLAMASATNWRPGQLGSLLQAMSSLQEIAETGDVRATDDADLDFQDVLAAASNLRRVLMMFRRLTIQLKLFTTVMGLKYAYSIEEIIADDTAILDAVRHRDAAEARRLWDRKMEAAVRYMVRQLERAD